MQEENTFTDRKIILWNSTDSLFNSGSKFLITMWYLYITLICGKKIKKIYFSFKFTQAMQNLLKLNISFFFFLSKTKSFYNRYRKAYLD